MRGLLKDPVILGLIALLAASYVVPDEHRNMLAVAFLGGAVGYLYFRVDRLTDRVEKLEKWQAYHVKQYETYRSYLSEKIWGLEKDR